ncbi:MAG: protein tyrosine phosphatase [Rhodobacteraceae bacterium]|nr:protein tyrosine phosphatase [Paracoccaceae bacterium]
MLKKSYDYIKMLDSKLRRAFGKDLETPSGRFWARIHYHLFDHAFLRVFWTNHKEISPGVFRSNQPTEWRFISYHAKGLRSVLNLRGWDVYAHYQYEERICRKLGMRLENIKLNARNAPQSEDINAIVDCLGKMEKPLLFHCKSGADRAGLVSAIYLMVYEGVSVQEAMKQLSFRHVHVDFTATGVLDYFLWTFEERLNHGNIAFLDWVNSEYDPETLQEAFEKRRPLAETLESMRQANLAAPAPQ